MNHADCQSRDLDVRRTTHEEVESLRALVNQLRGQVMVLDDRLAQTRAQLRSLQS